MTKDDVQMVGRAAYSGAGRWSTSTIAPAFSKAPERISLGGTVPMAPGYLTMLNDYINRKKTLSSAPTRTWSMAVGFSALDKGPIVFQVPDFGRPFLGVSSLRCAHRRSCPIGKQYGSKPGFYMIVGRDWKGEAPAGITGVVGRPRSWRLPSRAFCMDDTAEDKKAVQPVVTKFIIYPLSI